jgi:hypothetical protein
MSKDPGMTIASSKAASRDRLKPGTFDVPGIKAA